MAEAGSEVVHWMKRLCLKNCEVAFVLSKATYSKLTKDGALSAHWRELPRKIQDTISFCRSINERYLWVDRLCIVQDDFGDKDRQLNKMDVIYIAAILTIIAAEGSDCNAGLVGVSSARLAQSRLYLNDMEIITIHADVGESVKESVWNSRAWTFQENRLSPRKLFFTRSQATYACRKMQMLEALALEGIVSKPQYDSNRSNLNSLEEPCRIMPLTDLLHNSEDTPEYSKNTSKTSTNDDIDELFASHYRDVAEYLRRYLSDPQDVLKAFSGIVKGYEIFLGPILYGIPKRRIDIA